MTFDSTGIWKQIKFGVQDMLRITTPKNPEQAKVYFFRNADDYYLGGRDHAGHWHGEVAKKLGLEGRVQEEDFLALVENRHPKTGERLTGRDAPNRRPFYDFTFDVPKGISMLAALGHDYRIEQFIQELVVEAMAEMEKQVAVYDRKNGASSTYKTGNWVYATFLHTTTRPVGGVVEPHYHVHCVVMNLSFSEREQQFKAIEIRPIKENAPKWEALYHKALADKLTQAGYDLEKRGKLFDCRHIPESLTRKFSSRTALIERTARRLGVTDPKVKAQLGAKTRESKGADTLPDAERDALWMARCSPAERSAILGAVERAKMRPARVPQAPSLEAETEALDLAVRHCLTCSSVTTDDEVMTVALKHAVIDPVDPARMWQTLQANPRLIRSKSDPECFTTPEVLAQERDCIRYVQETKGTVRPLARGYRCSDPSHSEEQRNSINHLVHSTDRFNGLIGRSGTGKTKVLRTAVDAMERAGQRAMLLAPTSEAARDVLRANGFPEAETVSALLIDPRLREKAKNAVLIVDEAGLLSTQMTHDLFELCVQSNARCTLVGDDRQHHAVARGDQFRILIERGGLNVAHLSVIRRQTNPLYREGVEFLADGRVDKAIERFDQMGAIHEVSDDTRIEQLADLYLKRIQDGRKVLVVSPTNAEVREVAEAVRARLKRDGHLKGERYFKVLRAVNLTDAERESVVSYHEGQVLQFNQPSKGIGTGDRVEVVGTLARGVVVQDAKGNERVLDVRALAPRFEVYEPDILPVAIGDRIRVSRNGRTNGHRVSNGQLATVTGFADDGSIKLANGVSIGADFQHIDSGICVSSHASQGKSVDEVILSVGVESLAATNLEQFYVSASRGRERLHMFLEDRELFMEAAKISSRRLSAIEMVEPRIREALRARALAMKDHLGGHDQTRPKLKKALERGVHRRAMELDVA